MLLRFRGCREFATVGVLVVFGDLYQELADVLNREALRAHGVRRCFARFRK